MTYDCLLDTALIDEIESRELQERNICTDEEDNDMEVWYD